MTEKGETILCGVLYVYFVWKWNEVLGVAVYCFGAFCNPCYGTNKRLTRVYVSQAHNFFLFAVVGFLISFAPLLFEFRFVSIFFVKENLD